MRMRMMMFGLMAIVMSLTAQADRKRGIAVSQLPQAAQTFLTAHFKDAKVAMATTERDWMRKEYNVLFTNGTKIEFDANGQWENIECRVGYVPDAVIPAAIASYLKEVFPGARVVEIDQDRNDYEVELSDGTDIKFDKQFRVFKISR